MGCGCGKTNDQLKSQDHQLLLAKKLIAKQKKEDLKIHRASCAAMCCACGYSNSINPVICRAEQTPQYVSVRITNNACPLGRFPDTEGIVQWKGFRWWDVPYLIRVWLKYRHPKHPLIKSWNGCGCLVRLKGWTNWIIDKTKIVYNK